MYEMPNAIELKVSVTLSTWQDTCASKLSTKIELKHVQPNNNIIIIIIKKIQGGVLLNIVWTADGSDSNFGSWILFGAVLVWSGDLFN